MNRGTKLKLNITTSLISQLATIISGFILPNFFFRYYGSEVNGLVTSITQFLAIISLCDCGVGAVVQAALYKPIAENNNLEISRIYKSSLNFFNKVALLLVLYMIILIIIFPKIINRSFSPLYTGILIFSVTISMLAQYYFAITDKLVLNAAQLSFVQMIVSTITTILNIIISVFLMSVGTSIQIVKLASSVVFLIQPLIFKLAVRRNFNIDRKVVLDGEPIKQKWNGLAQHIATVVLENTPVLLLTVLSTLSNVSIYAVYHLVTNGLKLVFTTVANNMKSLLGDMYARKEFTLLDTTFSQFEWLMHTLVSMVYSIAAVVIVPFVKVYTLGVTDADYIIPIFGYLLCMATAIYVVRLPYSQMILSVGHFKETQSSAIIEVVLNLVVSIVTIIKFGLVGVALGMAVAMIYRTIYFVWYLSKNILRRKMKIFWKQIIVDILYIAIVLLSTSWIDMSSVTYFSWLIMAIKVGIIALLEAIIINIIFSKSRFMEAIRLFIK